MNSDFEKIKNRINQDNHFLQSNRMRVIDIAQDEAAVSLQITEDILNIYGMVHGGAIFSLADTAAGAASFTQGRECVTQNASMNFIASASEGTLYANAKCIHSGRKTGVCTVDVLDDQGRLVASSLFTMFFLGS